MELISYEGTMSPASGPCSEFTANDIGVSQSNSTSADESLQKTGTGSVSSDFTWVGPVAKTKGGVNDGQSFDTTPTTFTVTSTALDYYIDNILHASVTLQRGKTTSLMCQTLEKLIHLDSAQHQMAHLVVALPMRVRE